MCLIERLQALLRCDDCIEYVLLIFCSHSVSVIWVKYSKEVKFTLCHEILPKEISQIISWGFGSYWQISVSFRMQRLTFWKQCRTCWDIAQTLQAFSNLWQSFFCHPEQTVSTEVVLGISGIAFLYVFLCIFSLF